MSKILLLVVIALKVEITFQKSDVCKEFLKQWMESKCDDSSHQNEKCYSYKKQKIKMDLEISTLFVNCETESPDVNVLRCLPHSGEAGILIMEDCSFRSYNMSDLIFNTSISKVHLNYTKDKVASNINVIFSDLNKLRNITIEGTRISSPFCVKLYSLPNLFSLNMVNSNFTEFCPEPFKELSNLQELCLRIGLIESIPQTLFMSLFNLRVLDLRDNRIKSLEPIVFSNLTLLRELYLSDNKLNVINSGTFNHLINLYELHLSFNPIDSFPDSMPFGPSKHLSIVRVTNCKLKELPKVNWSYHDLRVLDYTNNVMEEVNLAIYTHKSADVILRNNTIKTITVELEQWHSASPKYHIRNNQLDCDCKLEKFLQFLHSSIQQLRRIINDAELEMCHTPDSISITKVWPEKLNCTIEDCPDSCNCLRTSKGYINVNCANKRLSEPPSVIPFGTVAIYLQNNNISSLSTIDAYTWQKVTELYLSGNLLKVLEDTFIPAGVNTLDVSYNCLTDILSSIMETINVTDNYSVYLANNKWICHCESTEFFEWFIMNKDKIADSNQTFCTTNGNSKERLIIQNVELRLLCKDMLSAPIVVILMFTVTLAVLSLMFVGYYYRDDIYPLLYHYSSLLHATSKKPDRNKTFDIFMIYHEEDREYANDAVHRLQDSNRLLKYEYTSLPDPIVECNIQSSLASSRRTLFIVSKTLLDCNKFKEDFFQTYLNDIEHKSYNFIIIVIGKVNDIANLECGYYIICLNRVVLNWNERWFWKKLDYHLRPTADKDDEFTEIPLQ